MLFQKTFNICREMIIAHALNCINDVEVFIQYCIATFEMCANKQKITEMYVPKVFFVVDMFTFSSHCCLLYLICILFIALTNI